MAENFLGDLAMSWKRVDPMEERCRFVLLASEPRANLSELCREFGISRRIGYKWLYRFHQEGLHGLEDRSRRPLRCPRETAGEVVCEIVSIRQAHPRWGGVTIHEILKRRNNCQDIPSSRTIDRILSRCGMVKTRKRGKRRKYSPEQVVIPKGPNDVWTVDFKGWWFTKDGNRCLPLTLRDEYSRYILDLAALAKGNTKAVRERFERCFERYGLPRYIRSDNGSPFCAYLGLKGLSRLSVWWLKHGVFPNRIPPGSPQYNGGHERMHRDIKAELQRTPAKNLRLQQDVFDKWRKEFNVQRPHRALNMATPSECYDVSARKYCRTIVPYDYGDQMESRKVCCRGNIFWRGKRRFVSSALIKEQIGVEILEDRMLSLWFRDFHLGTTDIEFAHPLGGG
jgi:putative transposase